MRGFFVRGLRGGIAIRLDKHEARRVFGLLENIELQNPQFKTTRDRIGEGGGLECFDAFGFHLDMDMNHQHGGVITEKIFRHKRAGEEIFLC